MLAHTSDRTADVFVTNYFKRNAPVTAGFACHEYDAHIKKKNFQDHVSTQEGFIYLSFILENFGKFPSDVSDFIQKMCAQQSNVQSK